VPKAVAGVAELFATHASAPPGGVIATVPLVHDAGLPPPALGKVPALTSIAYEYGIIVGVPLAVKLPVGELGLLNVTLVELDAVTVQGAE